jgi:hypothetical protein
LPSGSLNAGRVYVCEPPTLRFHYVVKSVTNSGAEFDVTLMYKLSSSKLDSLSQLLMIVLWVPTKFSSSV